LLFVVDLADIGDIGGEDLVEPELDVALDDAPDAPLQNNSDDDLPLPFGVSTPEHSDDERALPSRLPSWAGQVKYQFQGLDLVLPLSGFHVEGI
jgi:hypothetical protein